MLLLFYRRVVSFLVVGSNEDFRGIAFNSLFWHRYSPTVVVMIAEKTLIIHQVIVEGNCLQYKIVAIK